MLGHNQRMLVAALDTTTRLGSLALVRDRRVLAARAGDGTRPHAARLPGDLLALLAEHGLALSDVDVFAAATGPGSFTGLRIGLAAIQGLAFASGRPAVGVSAFEALAAAVRHEGAVPGGAPLAIWLDAQRHEVFAAVVRMVESGDGAGPPVFEYLDNPSVARPSVVLARWMKEPWWEGMTLAGDGAPSSGDTLAGTGLRVLSPTPLLAPAIGWLADLRISAGAASAPHAVRPLYVRRSDVELARDRRREGGA